MASNYYMSLPEKTFYLGMALLALLLGLIVLSMLGALQKAFLVEKVFSLSNPVGLLAVFFIITFGGIYLFKAAERIMKAAVK